MRTWPSVSRPTCSTHPRSMLKVSTTIALVLRSRPIVFCPHRLPQTSLAAEISFTRQLPERGSGFATDMRRGMTARLAPLESLGTNPGSYQGCGSLRVARIDRDGHSPDIVNAVDWSRPGCRERCRMTQVDEIIHLMAKRSRNQRPFRF